MFKDSEYRRDVPPSAFELGGTFSAHGILFMTVHMWKEQSWGTGKGEVEIAYMDSLKYISGASRGLLLRQYISFMHWQNIVVTWFLCLLVLCIDMCLYLVFLMRTGRYCYRPRTGSLHGHCPETPEYSNRRLHTQQKETVPRDRCHRLMVAIQG